MNEMSLLQHQSTKRERIPHYRFSMNQIGRTIRQSSDMDNIQGGMQKKRHTTQYQGKSFETFNKRKEEFLLRSKYTS